jgi:hypothetical protein
MLENEILGNYDPIQNERAENVTFEEDGLGEIMNSENTWLTCVFGFAVFALRGFARQYMVVRLYGWT